MVYTIPVIHRLSGFVWICYISFVNASIYSITNSDWMPTFSHAEKMFATDQGPLFARKGKSIVSVQIDAMNVTKIMNGWDIVSVFYHARSYRDYLELQASMEKYACYGSFDNASVYGAKDIEAHRYPLHNDTFQAVSVTYEVRSSGWISTQIFTCPRLNEKKNNETMADKTTDTAPVEYVTPVVNYRGLLTLQNPSGLLPAALYGMLPFSGFIAIGYVVLYIFFAFMLVVHRSQIIGLHYGIFAILFMGTLTSTLWFVALYLMNKSGEPVCCPFPTKLLVAVISSTLMKTLARVILIVVCLGYGIVRNRLTKCEKSSIVILSFAYLASGIGDEISRGTSSGIEFRQPPTTWSLLQLVSDLVFIIWIHVSMERILQKLNEEKQFFKLRMYHLLAWSLASFIISFSVLTMIAISSHVGVFEWSVEWEWTQLVSWPVLDFVVTAAMTIIWRPTRTSSQLAYSMQLPFAEDVEMNAQPSLTSTKAGSDDHLTKKDSEIQESRTQSATFVSEDDESDVEKEGKWVMEHETEVGN